MILEVMQEKKKKEAHFIHIFNKFVGEKKITGKSYSPGNISIVILIVHL